MNEIEIVLVELGRLPNYTILNLERLNILFPQIPKTLITDVPKRVDRLTKYVKIVEWETKTLGALEGLKIYRETKNKF